MSEYTSAHQRSAKSSAVRGAPPTWFLTARCPGAKLATLSMMKRATGESTADAYLELLAARGVEYFFANAGTGFAPIIVMGPMMRPQSDCR